MSCIICCEDYTDVFRKPVTCPNCKKDICLSCFKRHLSGDRSLSCIFPECDKKFSFIEISRLAGSVKFSNDIMENLGAIALEEEKNFLPQRQNLAKRKLEERKFNERSKLRSEAKSKLYTERWHKDKELCEEFSKDAKLIEIEAKFRHYNELRKQRKLELYEKKKVNLQPYNEEIAKLTREDNLDRQITGIIVKNKENHYKFIKQCSREGCKGFLEDNKEEKGWKCTLCDRFTCHRCHEPLEKGHECNPDIIQNLKEMKKDTKPCPKCGTGIFKIDGCDIMFCINCQTYFSWNTGKIHTRSLHNPDAVRWMREQGRAIQRSEGDDGCTDPFRDNMIYINWLYRVKRTYFNGSDIVFNTILELIDRGNHISEVILPRYNDQYINQAQNSAIEYLIKDDYNEKKWKSDIKKYKKQQMFYNELYNTISLLIEVARTTLNNIRRLVEENKDISEIIYQIELIPKLAEECNDKIKDIKSCFNSKRRLLFHIIREEGRARNRLYSIDLK